jgi:Sulfotransferase domain
MADPDDRGYGSPAMNGPVGARGDNVPGADRPAIPRSAKGVIHSASLAAGWLSHQVRMLPGFLIVGAQRCGTTSMYRTLSQHPAVLKPVLHKGVHYFDMSYTRSLGWYQAHFPLGAHGRRVERHVGVPGITFESSPYYMFHPLAAERILRDLPEVKLLVLVRDPVERAYSAHAHELARGYESVPFEQALDMETTRLEGEAERISTEPGYLSMSHQHHAYLARGQYIQQLDRLERLFGRARIHVVDSGDFFTEPKSVYDPVLEFLRLPLCGYPAFERHNARPRAPMPKSLRAALQNHFNPYDERLAEWLGREPSWRR